MAWTAPLTFTAGTTLTAAQLNTYLRDNLLESAPAKATIPGSYMVSTGVNTIAQRKPGTDYIATAESATSTSYSSLSTVGPFVSVTTGPYCFIIISCRLENNTADAAAHMSWAISGATTRAASDSVSITRDGMPGGNHCRFTQVDLLSDLTPGVNNFEGKYRVSSGTGTWADRRLTAFPF